MQILSLETSQPASQSAIFVLTGTEEVSILMQKGSQIEPLVFKHEGRDREVPGWIPRA